MRLHGVTVYERHDPKGFVASGVAAGLKKEGLDLAIVRSTVPAVGAAMFTRNRVLAAPVIVSKQHLAEAQPQAVVLYSGSERRDGGERGLLDAEADPRPRRRGSSTSGGAGARLLGTGVIGVRHAAATGS